jgi:hypothetical protein
MTEEFAIKKVALDILAHLELHRERAAQDEAATRAAVGAALEPVRRAYADSQLPVAYLQALDRELETTLASAWRAVAVPFTELEKRRFGLWRGGDLVARLTYVVGGLSLGGLIVWLPFIPIWEKWLPFAMALGGGWLPNAQVMWHRRRYARELGAIAVRLGARQGALEATVTMNELLPPENAS